MTPHAFEHAYREHRPRAFGTALAVLRDHAAAEDVAQDVFAHLWRRPAAFDPSRGSLPSYVTMLARSRAIDRLRTRSARDAAVDRLVATGVGADGADAAEVVVARE